MFYRYRQPVAPGVSIAVKFECILQNERVRRRYDSPLQARSARLGGPGNRIGPGLPRPKPETGATRPDFGVSYVVRPCRALAPEGPLWQETARWQRPFGPIPCFAHAAVAQW